MNTAEEMYQYCLDNDYGEGLTRKWGIKHFALIENALHRDEQVLMCFMGLHNYVGGAKHDGNYAYALTNERIIMAQKKAIGQEVQSVAIDYLNDITLSTGLIYGVVTIDTMKEVFNVALLKGQAQKINDKIHELLLSHKGERQEYQVDSQSSADEIMKFKNLLDMGVITQEEFEQKKRQLLGL